MIIAQGTRADWLMPCATSKKKAFMRIVDISCSRPAILIAAISFLVTGCGGSETDDSLWTTVQVDGVSTASTVLILQGPGFDIERIHGFDATGKPNDVPGNATERNLVLEADGATAVEYRAYFDAYRIAPKIVGPHDGTIIVPNPDGTEAFSWIFTGFAPSGMYTSGDNGRTRLKLTCILTNANAGWQLEGSDPFGRMGSFTPSTDSRIDIVGVTTNFYPSVEVDSRNRTLTLDFNIMEGNGLFGWVKDLVEGKGHRRNVILTRLDRDMSQGLHTTYMNCFPIQYEQYSGYDLVTRIKARVVLAYCTSSDD